MRLTMKLKARDVVAGWPKGRSTSIFLPDRYELAWFRFAVSRSTYSELRFEIADRQRWLDLQQTVEYHEAQQAMVDRHFQERYRPWSITDDPAFIFARDGGRIAGS